MQVAALSFPASISPAAKAVLVDKDNANKTVRDERNLISKGLLNV
jgi:hypothetical protein